MGMAIEEMKIEWRRRVEIQYYEFLSIILFFSELLGYEQTHLFEFLMKSE
jgi:hypothetical protein